MMEAGAKGRFKESPYEEEEPWQKLEKLDILMMGIDGRREEVMLLLLFQNKKMPRGSTNFWNCEVVGANLKIMNVDFGRWKGTGNKKVKKNTTEKNKKKQRRRGEWILWIFGFGPKNLVKGKVLRIR